MLDSYSDILELIDQEPLWWDRFGCPRYKPYNPADSSNIYADRVAIMRIACQACGKEFIVEFAESRMERVLYEKRLKDYGHEIPEYDPTKLQYGDPPNACCAAGSTMSSFPRELVAAWENQRFPFEWVQTHANIQVRADWDTDEYDE